MRLFHLWLAAAVFFLVSCASTSILQTARTLPQRTLQLAAGLDYILTPGELRTLKGEGVDFDAWKSEGSLTSEGGIRYGISGNLDMGGRVTLPFAISGDIKRNLVSTEAFALAVGFQMGVGAASGILPDRAQDDLAWFPLDFFLPVYLSYDFSQSTSLYSALRANLRWFPCDNNTSVTKYLLGGNLGVKLGEKKGFFIEMGGLRGLQWNHTELQFTAAVFMNFER